MKRVFACLMVCLSLLASATLAVAQVRITGGISGTVTDPSGSVIPGATVTLKDEATAATREAISSDSGLFTFPDLNHGTYQVTVTLSGFQTSIFNKVVVESGRTTDLRVRMTVGALTEAITVEGAAPVLETTSNLISGTLNNKALNELPLTGRNVFAQARLVPGAVAPQGTGSTHYNGMPGGTINPTIDGVNNSSNGWKSGGTSFFGTVPARLGAIEEVTVETSGQGAESGAMGGVNLKFVTRRGTNQFRGSAFEQHRNDAFNANTFSNNARQLPKAELNRHDFGGNFGGPLLAGTRWRDKLFLFLNYEQEYIPNDQTITRTVLRPEANNGIFQYRTASGEVRSADLLAIAAQNGFTSTMDPTIAALLAKQASAAPQGRLASTNSLITQDFIFNEPSTTTNYYPTARLDLQITPSLAWMGSWNLYRQDVGGWRRWPLGDIPVQEKFVASWWITSTGLNWSINSSTHNEFRYGVQHSGDTTPGRERDYYLQNGTVNGLPARFNLPLGLGPMTLDAAPITGRHYITTIYDTLTMIRGNHTLKFGGTFRLSDWRDTSLDGTNSGGYLGLPAYSIGSPTGDPVQSIFNTTTMPGVQATDLANAYNLYALMTGRLTRIRTGRVLDSDTLQYSDQVYRENWTASKMGGLYAQDQWRMTPNFTLNYGLRYEISGAPYSKLSNVNFPDVANLYGPSSALFQPGVLNGVANPTLVRGDYAAKIDYNNFAPNVGFAWTPNLNDGWIAKLIGRGETSVIRGGYSTTYYDEGTNMFAFNSGSNPGGSQSLDLQPGMPGFTAGGLSLRTPLPPFVAFPLQYQDVFPQADFTFSSGFRTMKDDLKTPYVHSWNIGLQRQIMKDTVVEARYIGTRGENVWRTYNINEVNIFENGFLQEFRNAQNNLAINTANGRTGFANNGLPGQVALPIFDAAFGARGSQAALPAASGYTNGGFITNLQQGTAGALANSIGGNSTYACRMLGSSFEPCARLGFNAAGSYPINFWYANPFAGSQGAFIVDDDSYTRYHAMQLQLRRRFSQGLQLNLNYTLGKNTGDIWADNSTQEVNYRTLRDRKLDDSYLPHDVRHVFQAFGTWDIPVGRDRAINVSNPVLNAVVGGWTLAGTLNAQSGTPFRLTSGRNTFNQFTDSGVVLLNGTTVEDLQNALRMSDQPNLGFNRLWIDPKYIAADGRANPEFIGVPTTPGELGQLVVLRSMPTYTLDGAVSKAFDLPGRAEFGVHVTVQNVFNHPTWGTPGFLGTANVTSTTFGQTGNPITTGSLGSRQLYVRAEVRF